MVVSMKRILIMSRAVKERALNISGGRVRDTGHFSLLALIALLAFLPLLAFGQVDTGTIAGTVRDPSGAAVPDATVTVRNASTGAQRVVQTAGDGTYTVPALLPATYDVT